MRRQPRVDAIGQPPVDEQRLDLGHAEVALVALALAHDVEQNRPFAVHQRPVDPAPVALGALEIRVHVSLDLAGGQAALGPAARIRPVAAEIGETRDFALMHLGGGVEDARADAMLVQRTIAQRVELCAGPPALQQAQGIEAVGDQGHRVGLHPDQFLLQALLAAGGLDGLAKLRYRHDVATDEPLRHHRAQEGTRIIGRNRGTRCGRAARNVMDAIVCHGAES